MHTHQHHHLFTSYMASPHLHIVPYIISHGLAPSPRRSLTRLKSGEVPWDLARLLPRRAKPGGSAASFQNPFSKTQILPFCQKHLISCEQSYVSRALFFGAYDFEKSPSRISYHLAFGMANYYRAFHVARLCSKWFLRSRLWESKSSATRRWHRFRNFRPFPKRQSTRPR